MCPITEPVIVRATTGTPAGASPLRTTREPSPVAAGAASAAAGATRAASSTSLTTGSRICAKYRQVSFPAFQGSVKLLLGRSVVVIEAVPTLAAEQTGVPHRDEARRRSHPRLAELVVERLARVHVD